MLLILASTGLAAGQVEVSARYRADRDREAELIFRGGEFVRAIESFYLAEPDPNKRRLPRGLNELEKDSRFVHRRHIRRVYEDPTTGGAFRLLMVAGEQGSGLVGVASESDQPLFKRTGFGPEAPFSNEVARTSELRFEVDLDMLAAEGTPLPAQGRKSGKANR